MRKFSSGLKLLLVLLYDDGSSYLIPTEQTGVRYRVLERETERERERESVLESAPVSFFFSFSVISQSVSVSFCV